MVISDGISFQSESLPPRKTPIVAPTPLSSSTHGTRLSSRPVTSSSVGVM